jgi:hypothetical protein
MSSAVGCGSGGSSAADTATDAAASKNDSALGASDNALPYDGLPAGKDGSASDLTVDVALDSAVDVLNLDTSAVDVGAHETSLDGGGPAYEALPNDVLPPTPDLAFEAKEASAPETGAVGLCSLSFANSTANLVSASTPLTNNCVVAEFDDAAGKPAQWNFGADDTIATSMRSFNVDWFDVTSPVGTTLKVENGYDIASTPWKGINVSYMESTSTGDTYSWTGDKGLVTLTSISGKTFTFHLASVHFSPMTDPFGTNKASGGFELSGTVTADLKVVK